MFVGDYNAIKEGQSFEFVQYITTPHRKINEKIINNRNFLQWAKNICNINFQKVCFIELVVLTFY